MLHPLMQYRSELQELTWSLDRLTQSLADLGSLRESHVGSGAFVAFDHRRHAVQSTSICDLQEAVRRRSRDIPSHVRFSVWLDRFLPPHPPCRYKASPTPRCQSSHEAPPSFNTHTHIRTASSECRPLVARFVPRPLRPPPTPHT